MSAHFLLPPFTLLLLLFPSTTNAATTTVLDTDGHPLRANTNYYILPVVRGRGGGLTMLPKNKTTSCPLYAGQESHKVSNGLPLKLLPLNPKQEFISLSSDLNIGFDAATICVQSTAWEVAFDEATGRRYIATGGHIGNPGVETLGSWFNIQKAKTGRFHYKIGFCPGVCPFCTVLCGDVGVFVEEGGKRLLSLTDKPLLVMFKKAS